jgi:cytochrome bd-type quinol oxidase subunit 1
VSRSITATDLFISLIGFILLYGTLAAVEAFLLVKYARKTED